MDMQEKNNDESVNNMVETKQWVMKSDLIFLGTRNTKLLVEGRSLEVDQYNSLGVKWGRQSGKFDIMDITRIERSKRTSYGAVGCLLIAALVLLENSSSILGWVVLLLSLKDLKEKLLIIQHNGGVVKIGTKDNKSVDDFINYVKQYNPNVIKNVIE
ncbi:hypothetical protein [Selenomonas ruminantium]|uniref:Uncharacterized protein n=1 Tax=Selenomonas ruminantium TaxID=971 RepID=A0A1H3W7W2_SELRU|nr:hypothetical protein [Selenomonas ruminantium]SDZ83167.1 hypothetical protein SAMN05660648_00768 [Selenomonas ruminantium]